MSHVQSYTSPSSASSILAQLTNDETTSVVICTPVYSDGPGTFKKALGDGSAKATAIGVVIDQSIPAGSKGAVLRVGVVTASTAQWDAVCGTSGGLTYGTLYYLSTTVAGTLTTSNASGKPVIFGLGPTVGAIVTASNSSGGITNSAPNHSVMLSDGANATPSSITDNLTNVQFTHAGVCPYDIRGSATNTWDLSPMITANTDPATIRVFGQTVTSTPSVDQSLTFAITPGTGGAGGVWLRPNGYSYFDPDGWAQHAKILAVGFTVPQYELDVRDPGNAHVSDTDGILTNGGTILSMRVINANGTATFNTGATHPTNYDAVHAEALASKTSGSQTLTNRALYGTAANGDTNQALVTDAGDVVLNNTGGTTTVKGAFSATAGGAALSGSKTIITGTSGYTLSVGPESDDTYFLNGNIAYGWAVNSADHLNINFFGYQGGATQPRSLNIYDGQNNLLATFAASGLSLTVTGNIVGGNIKRGAGNPNGGVTGNCGDIYINTSGGAGTTLFVREAAGSGTVWVGK